MKKSLYQSILAMLLSIVTLTPVANPVAMAAQIEHEPDSFVEELEESDESDDAGQGKDIPTWRMLFQTKMSRTRRRQTKMIPVRKMQKKRRTKTLRRIRSNQPMLMKTK